jgi:cyclic nucleotide-binding protein
MRIESSVTAVSWLPSEAVRGIRKLPFAIGAARYDDPPPDVLVDAASLAQSGAVRQVNELKAWIEVDDGRVTDAGYAGGGHAGVFELGVGDGGVRGRDAVMPLLQQPPAIDGGTTRFVQSFGGRVGVPIPRRVAGLPLMRVVAPLAWTTLALTVRADGTAEGSLVGASSFPRHWVYDAQGRLATKSAEIDFDRWLEQPSDRETPWGQDDEAVPLATVESEFERELSKEIMRGRRQVQTLQAGQWLTEQGANDSDVFLILDGIFDVYVGGQEVAEVGPGSIVGERASAEGRRTATLQARTTCRVVRFDPSELSPEHVQELASRHRREDD